MRSEELEQDNTRLETDRGASAVGGYVRKTVRQLCSEAGISTEQGIKLLSAQGMSASANDRIRALADKHGLKPSVVSGYIHK